MFGVLLLLALAPVDVEAVAPEVITVLDEDTPGVGARFVVHAGADEVLALLEDAETVSRPLFQSVKAVKVERRTPDVTHNTYTVDGFGDLIYTTENRVTRHPGGGGVLTWRRIAGDIDVVEGSWVFTPAADPAFTRCDYVSKVAMGPGFLSGLVRSGIKDATVGLADRLRGLLAQQAAKRTAKAAAMSQAKAKALAEVERFRAKP